MPPTYNKSSDIDKLSGEENNSRITVVAFVFLLIASLAGLGSCSDRERMTDGTAPQAPSTTTEVRSPSKATADNIDYDTTKWMELTTDQGFALELRYADESNFTGEKIYDCGRCFMHKKAGQKLLRLQQDISKRYGWRLRIYDCYRPRPAQQRLWDIMPNASYVTPPHKGSMHNRGLAVDLTIDDEDGDPMDMGTDFDYFGRAAHTDNHDHSEQVLRNRRILQKLMNLHGFKGIRTEWWHYSLRGISNELSDWEWEC